MLKKQFSSTDPFKRLKPQIRYVIGGQAIIPLGNMTVEQFNSLVDGIDNIERYYVSSSDAWVRVYHKDSNAKSLIRSYLPGILKTWNGADDVKDKGSYTSFNLKCAKDTLTNIIGYLNQIVAGGHIVKMVSNSKEVDSSKYGQQANGQTYVFNAAQTIITTATKNKTEDTTGQDVDGDGYIGDPANGKKAKDSKEDEEMSFTTILFIMAAVLVVALLIKKNK